MKLDKMREVLQDIHDLNMKNTSRKFVAREWISRIFYQSSTVSLIPLSVCGLRLRDTLGSTAIILLKTTYHRAE